VLHHSGAVRSQPHFGKPLLLPLMSPEAFTAWSEWAKYAHII